MARLLLAAAAAAALLAFGATAGHAGPAPCTRTVSPAYAGSVARAVQSGRDLWGDRLLGLPDGPSYAAARRYLTPLTRGMQWHGRTLTASGSYYVPFSFPFTSYGSTVFALHVADGSEILTRRIDGPSLKIYVGSGSEAYGSCATRLQPARLADGWLPILQTAYTDAGGVRYGQESFVGRAYGAYGARSVISFVKLTVDASGSDRGATVRLVPWKLLAHTAPDRLASGGMTRLIVSDGAEFVDGVVRYRVPAGEMQTIYAEWLNAPSDARYVHADAASYDAARRTVTQFWQGKLGGGASISVPEPAIEDAMRGVITQLIAYGWRYSIGNAYEELSYAESLDAAEVAAEYGYPTVAQSILDFSLQRMRARPWRFTAFRGGHILATAAAYYRLTHDRAFMRAHTAELASLVDRIAERRRPNGLLKPEPLSTDLENHDVVSVSGQVEAVTGLLAIGSAWRSAGYPTEAARAERLARSIDRPLHRAVAKGSKRLRDGSLFVPDQLPQRPFGRLTATRDGSYWNLMMPYAFASGWFTPSQSHGILDYLLAHGGRLLGVPRTSARTVYHEVQGAGLAPVYGLGVSRLLADENEPDQLVLSLYGMRAAGMTESTYISGEAVSVLPVRGAYARSMFMPPNTGANASFLGTLREMLVHEGHGKLDLAFSTPRAWLGDGKTIAVDDAPTSFGKVSYTLTRSGSAVHADLILPRVHVRLRLRTPTAQRTIDLGRRGGHVVLTVKV